jgi:hypothetical protein
MLSREVLQGCQFFLDTNVLVVGLIPSHWHHRSLRAVVDSCRRLGIDFLLAGITAQELRGLVGSHATDLRRVIDRIPPKLLPRVRNFLLEGFLAAQQHEPGITLEDFLDRFDAPVHRLEEQLGFQLVDDRWFDDERDSTATLKLAGLLSERYVALRGRPKRQPAAVHDALLLRWIAMKNRSEPSRGRLLSLDLSLPGARTHEMGDEVVPVIGFDALLQWTGSVGIEEDGGGAVAELYSHALAFELLPKDTFFVLRDFRAFAEMDIEAAHLPPEDVEACIRQIRALGPETDPSKAEDREKIGRVLQQYFADPGSKYHRAMARHAKERATLEAKLEEERQKRMHSEATTSSEVSQLRRDIDELKGSLDRERLARVQAEESQREAQRLSKTALEREQKRTLRTSVLSRSAVLAIALVSLWAVVAAIASAQGSGETVFQKLTGAGLWFGAAFALIAAISPFVMGKERLRLIKTWKGEAE